MRTLPYVMLVVLLAPTTSRADDKADAAREAAARAAVNALVKEDFKAAAKDFDATMQKALPPEKLAALWKDLLARSGAFQKQLGARHEKAARFVAVADVYDALRCRRTYRPGLSHAAALRVMTESSAGHYDPTVLHSFQKCAAAFERIFRESRE